MSLRSIRKLSFKILLASVFSLTMGSIAYLSSLPNINSLASKNPTETSFMKIRRRQAQKLKKSFPLSFIWMDYEKISPFLRHAVIVAEDGRFYEHEGIDFEELKEAVKKNINKKKFAFGASTITQQLAKNLYLSPSKNPLRKIKEAIIAHQMENKLSKRRILEIYLNVIEWGPGIYGAEAASRHYFDKSSNELTAEESATLAAYLPSPMRYSKPKYAKYIARMTKRILRRMRLRGYLPSKDPPGV